MAEPVVKQQKIIDKLIEILEGIIERRGYEADLGKNVYDWKVTPFGQEQIPGVSINDTTDSIENDAAGIHDHLLPVKIKIKSFADAKKMRQIISDIYYTLGELENIQFGGLLADEIKWKNSSMDFEHRDKLIASAEINLELFYFTKPFNPYE